MNVGAMLIAFISLIALLNLILGAIGGLFGFDELSLQLVLGYVFAPVAFAIGVPWKEVLDAGSFIGQKVILNEFVAYSNFGPRVDEFSEKTVAIVTFPPLRAEVSGSNVLGSTPRVGICRWRRKRRTRRGRT